MEHMTEEQVKLVADMARMAISDEDAKIYAEQLSFILKNADELQELNTAEVEPTTHGGIVLKNVMREDVPKQTITQEEALKNAPDHEDGHFKVPAIME